MIAGLGMSLPRSTSRLKKDTCCSVWLEGRTVWQIVLIYVAAYRVAGDGI